MNSKTRTLACGLGAPIVYAATVIAGTMMWPDFSNARDPISLLSSTSSPFGTLMNILFTLYSILLLFFGMGWWFEQGGTSRLGRRAANWLVVVGILGIAMFFFPLDTIGSNPTPTGGMHIILEGASTLIAMLVMLLRGLAEWRDLDQRGRAVYSFLTLLIVVAANLLLVSGLARARITGGELERIAIGAFLLWLFTEAWAIRKAVPVERS